VTSDAEMPKLYKPMGQYEKSVQLVKEGFIILPYLNSVGSFTDMHVRNLANIAYLFATVEPQCNLGKIKGWVASGLPAVVILKSMVGARHARVIIGYDDSNQQLTATDPVSYRHIKISYDSFDKLWTDPQKTCLLIRYQSDNGRHLNTPLKRFLHKYRKSDNR
jgi:hypothetical protein